MGVPGPHWALKQCGSKEVNAPGLVSPGPFSRCGPGSSDTRHLLALCTSCSQEPRILRAGARDLISYLIVPLALPFDPSPHTVLSASTDPGSSYGARACPHQKSSPPPPAARLHYPRGRPMSLGCSQHETQCLVHGGPVIHTLWKRDWDEENWRWVRGQQGR